MKHLTALPHKLKRILHPSKYVSALSKKLNRVLRPSKDVQLRYLSQSARLEEMTSPRLVRLTALFVSFSVLAFIGWAAVTNINEVARTAGEVVPDGFEQTVQHLYGGIVEKIQTHEGAFVERGEVLLTLDGAGVKEDLTRAQRKEWALSVQAERLRAFLQDRDPDFSKFGAADDAKIKEQTGAFKTMVKARAHQANIIKDQLVQKQQDKRILQTRLVTAQKSLASGEELLSRRERLLKNGNINYVRFAETEQKVNELRGEVAVLLDKLNQADSTYQEYQHRLTSISTVHRDEAYKELLNLESELSQNREIIEKLQNRVDRLIIRSPVKGIVKGLEINTVGGVIQPGQSVAQILPLEKDLVVKVQIPPRHIGHVRVGQPVQLKISAYDFARYGAVQGKLKFISATTFAEKDGARYYVGEVQLSQKHVGQLRQRNLIMPGMTAMAEIITGEKTILQYLLKPIQVSLSQAFSER